MTSLAIRLRKDLQEVAGVDKFEKRLDKLEKDIARIEKEMQEFNKELGIVSRRTASITQKGAPKRKPLIQLIEEIMAEKGGGPMKVTEIKQILLKEKKIKTRAKNFYAVITVSLNNSPIFKKTGPGEYKLEKKSAGAKKAAAKKPAAKKAAPKKAAAKKKVAKKVSK
jgi:hypothetical protein